jgi:hypothetical protein
MTKAALVIDFNPCPGMDRLSKGKGEMIVPDP